MSDETSVNGNGLDATLREFSGGQKLFGRYTLLKILGRGGMGVVWLARDEVLEREVALKFLPELIVHDRAVLSDLKRETRRSLELTHKNIVRIHDFVHDGQSGCISMEYVDGDTLSNLRADKPRGVFEIPELTDWTRQLCDALDYAHNHARIIHRDLKPANLMVNQRGDLKVTDFGIARSLSDSMSKVTMQHGKSGTLVYMSPQQLDGERGNHLDDIYSFGACIYELLTGRPPFSSGNVDRQIREKIPPSMTQRREELEIEGDRIDESWERVVASCLAKDPARRPQAIAQLASLLNLGVPTARTAEIPSAKRFTKKTIMLGGIAAAVIAIAGTVTLAIKRGTLTFSPTTTNLVSQIAPEKLPTRLWLGIRMQTIGDDSTQRDMLPGFDKGVAVLEIDPVGPASKSQLQRFDAITHIDNIPVGTHEELRRELDKKKAAQPVKLTVWRKNQILNISITADTMPAAQALMLDAGEAQKRGDNRLAIELFRKAAEQGNAQAQFAYGFLFFEGKLVSKDYNKSAELFKSAADQGDPYGSSYLAIQYAQGQGVLQDYTKAAELLRKPAEEGNSTAQANLGWLYLVGKGVSQDYAKAVELLEKAVNQGHLGGLVTLGWCYELGHGVPQDFRKAAELYQKAAHQGNADAQVNLARLYTAGDGVSQDFTKAIELLQKAVSQGNLRATVALGNLYAEGKGIPKDMTKAAELWQKAADKDDPVAQTNLGMFYRDGKGVSQNYAKAVDLFRKAADKGFAGAQVSLGVLYQTGNGVLQDYSRAAELFEKAANQGDIIGQVNLGNLYLQGKGVLLNYKKAVELLEAPASQGNASAQCSLGWLYERGNGVAQNYTKALELYQKSTDQGFVGAYINLGILYSQGKGVPVNYVRAVELLQKAADLNLPEAQVTLGWLYEMGKGVPRDYNRAAELYQKAADQGNSVAQSNLANFYYNGKGVAQNRKKAIELWQKAAAEGNEVAKKNLRQFNASRQR